MPHINNDPTKYSYECNNSSITIAWKWRDFYRRFSLISWQINRSFSLNWKIMAIFLFVIFFAVFATLCWSVDTAAANLRKSCIFYLQMHKYIWIFLCNSDCQRGLNNFAFNHTYIVYLPNWSENLVIGFHIFQNNLND